ncbi:glucosyl-3-phosphoglycerate synthase [Corynebacterium breve]|uniref:Glucosyl-3-phosphoglycerate synthase n=1 Tax=Corynebacterium breve TaxID=3049799 RepID=A0ABY8VH81_9CORY|nr:glucosyl-3-phosphoglycerate synthase [Corynebacterium breve]WIM69009.1 glucosyl-3-phosphoglycerate synthase [Corynebacterium breve]
MTVSVVIPALNEEATVADVVRAVLVDNPLEVLVIDSSSSDATASKAQAAGATVLSWSDIAPEIPTRPGKGEALWRGVKAARGDVVVFVDADLTEVPPHVVSRLALPLQDPQVHMVKADYARTLDGAPSGGGRVTELTAKPLLRTYFPAISHINQPLAGEYALRRSTALDVPFISGYGVESGLLIDISERCGGSAITQVDLGTRSHRNRPLAELGPMAQVVAHSILGRAGVLPEEVAVPDQRPAWNTLG